MRGDVTARLLDLHRDERGCGVNDTCEKWLNAATDYLTEREHASPAAFWDGFRQTCESMGVTGRAERNVLMLVLIALRDAQTYDLDTEFARTQ